MSASLSWWIPLSEHLPEVVLLVWFFAVGACVGSMLNVVIYRMPRGMNLWWPRSHCPRCGRAILVRDNIPLCSWLRLRGRCRWCREPIPSRYPLVELACAGLFLAVALVEVHFRGWNLPAASRLAWQRAWYGFPWQPAALALLHAGVLSGLLAAATIAGDRFPVPWRLIAALSLLAVGAAWLFPRSGQVLSAAQPLQQGGTAFSEPLSWFSIAAAAAVATIVAGAAALFARVFFPAPVSQRETPAEEETGAAISRPRGRIAGTNASWLLLVPAILFGLPGLLAVLALAAGGALAAWALGRRNMPAWWCWGLWSGTLAVLFSWGWWQPRWADLGSGAQLGLTLAGLVLGTLGTVLAAARAPEPPPLERSPLEEKETGDDAIPPEPGSDP